MSNSVRFYENLFNKTFQETKDVFDLANNRGNQNDMGGIERIIAQGMAQSALQIASGATPELVAAATVFNSYSKKRNAHHKTEARTIIGIVELLMVSPRQRVEGIQKNKDMMKLFSIAILPTLGFNLEDKETKPDESMLQRLHEALPREIKSPSPEVTKSLIKFIIETTIAKSELASHKSDFASAAFVLVKKLNINIKTELMKKIIEGADFSEGFFQCSSAKNRRSQELAKLQNTMPAEEKQALRASI